MKRLTKAGVADLVDFVACSTDYCMNKPDPAFYRYDLNQANLSCDASAFVGYDAKELRGARRAGMAAAAVNHDTNARVDYYCPSITEIIFLSIFSSPGSESVG